jgi:TRAP transporter TAXI family solute receptor
MRRLRRRRGLIVALAFLGICWLALAYFIPAPPKTITIATGAEGTTFNYFGGRYSDRFARIGIRVELRETAGGLENFRLLQDRNSGVDIAFVTAGVGNASQAPDLLSAGAVFPTPSWLFYSTPEVIDSLPQLKGKRITVGPEGSGARQTAERILSKANVNASTATLLPYGGNDAAAALNDGRADAAFINSGIDAPAVAALLRNPRIRLMDFASSAGALSRIFPDVTDVVLPKGVIDLDPPNPPRDVTLIEVPGKVLLRDNLHPAVVQYLARTMKEEHDHRGLFQRLGEYPTSTDAEFPMSQIAADYYKYGPSFLHGYLPFWMTVYAQRLITFLVATLAIIFPVFGFAPRVFEWFAHEHVRKLYRRLRLVDQTLETHPSGAQLEALRHELADIDRAARDISLHNADLYFMLRYHVDRTHVRLREAGQAAAGH